MAKKVRRPQTPKAAMRTGRPMIVAMDSRGGDGFHKSKNHYDRKPKYGMRSLVMDY